jgi:D-methionine transport system ATP-binding protein
VTQSLLRSLQPSLPEDFAGAARALSSRVTIAGDEARQPLIAELALATGASVFLLHGGVDHVQDEPVGRLFLEAPGGDAAHFDAILSFLRHRAGEVEVLGHVAGDA